MTESAIKIEEINLRKSSGEINQAVAANGQIKNVHNDFNISYFVLNDGQGPNNILNISLKCNIYTKGEANFATDGELSAHVEVIYQVLLSSAFDSKYIDNIMYSVWPYLRIGAAHQLQLINLGFIGEKLPLEVFPSKSEK